jgi:hypothetical protein
MSKRTNVTLGAPVAALKPSEIPPPILKLEQHQGRTRAVWSASAGGICLLVLLILVRAFSTDLHVPFSYGGDSFYFLSVVRGLIDNQSWLYNSELNFPFGADMRDFPQFMAVDYSALWLLGKLIKHPGLLLNLYWMNVVALTASLATYSFLRLGLDRRVALTVGVLYALQPYTFFRNTVHFNLIFYCVPVLAGFMVEWIVREKSNITWKPPAVVIVFAIVQGLSYIYNTFFAAVLLLVTAGMIILRMRNWRSSRPVILVLALLVGSAAVNLSPTFFLWARHGKNPSLSYKTSAQAEVFGLKIRHLLTPIENHPLDGFRRIQQDYDGAGYPLENENRGSRLGTIGSVGFLFLLGYTLWRVTARQSFDPRLDAAAALTLAGLGLATVGGLGAIFNAFVAPDVRCYNRIVTFLSYFALLAVGVLLTTALKRWTPPGTRARISVVAVLAAVLILGILDQASWSAFQMPLTGVIGYTQRRNVFYLESQFVKQVEARLGHGAALFNLPYSDFPTDTKVFTYAHALPYIWGGFKVSWGALTGRGSEWAEHIARQPVDKMLPQLALAGFDGVWVNTLNYEGGLDRSPIPALRATPGLTSMVSRDGSYHVFDIRAYRDTVLRSLPPGEARTLHFSLSMEWNGSFYPEESAGGHVWHWCGNSGTIRIVNTQQTERRVKVSMLLHGSGDAAQRIKINGPGFEEEKAFSSAVIPFERDVSVSANGQLTLSFSANGQALKSPGETRVIYFGVSDLQIIDR